jgi:uncharacterized protein (TIGR03000 family)
MALSGPAVAAPAHQVNNSNHGSHPGNNPGYHPGYNPGYHSGVHTEFHNYYRFSNPGYYPGYFSNYYRGYSPGLNIGLYSAPYGYSSGYSSPTYLYNAAPSVPYLATGAPDKGQEPPAPNDGSASVGVHVPADADVWFDGDATQQKGEFREYATPTLPLNREYQYEIRARWTDNGKPVEQTRTITVRANQRTEVDFTRPEPLKAPKLTPFDK